MEREVVNMAGPGNEQKPKVHCPHCGYDINTPGIEVSDDDKKEYLRRMLEGQLFSKKYTYLEGNIEIDLTELDTKTTDELVQLIRMITDEDMVLLYAFRAKFMACCSFLKVGERILIEKQESDLSNLEKLNDKYKKLVGDMGAVPTSLAEDSLKDFSLLIDGVIQEAVTSKAF